MFGFAQTEWERYTLTRCRYTCEQRSRTRCHDGEMENMLSRTNCVVDKIGCRKVVPDAIYTIQSSASRSAQFINNLICSLQTTFPFIRPFSAGKYSVMNSIAIFRSGSISFDAKVMVMSMRDLWCGVDLTDEFKQPHAFLHVRTSSMWWPVLSMNVLEHTKRIEAAKLGGFFEVSAVRSAHILTNRIREESVQVDSAWIWCWKRIETPVFHFESTTFIQLNYSYLCFIHVIYERNQF